MNKNEQIAKQMLVYKSSINSLLFLLLWMLHSSECGVLFK